MEDIDLENTPAPSNDKYLAVKISNAYKTYSSTVVVLDGFNMNVEKGTM